MYNLETITDLQNKINRNQKYIDLLTKISIEYIENICNMFNTITDIKLLTLRTIIPGFKLILEENYKMVYINNERIGHLFIDANKNINLVLTMDNNKKISLIEFIKNNITYSLITLLYLTQIYNMQMNQKDCFDSVLTYFEPVNNEEF